MKTERDDPSIPSSFSFFLKATHLPSLPYKIKVQRCDECISLKKKKKRRRCDEWQWFDWFCISLHVPLGFYTGNSDATPSPTTFCTTLYVTSHLSTLGPPPQHLTLVISNFQLINTTVTIFPSSSSQSSYVKKLQPQNKLQWLEYGGAKMEKSPRKTPSHARK